MSRLLVQPSLAGKRDTRAASSACCMSTLTSQSPLRPPARTQKAAAATLSTPSEPMCVTPGSIDNRLRLANSASLQDLEVRRRYSDFYSLRQTLVNLHPTLIIPPIPEKHSVADYAAKPTKAKEDEAIIDHRKRMLGSFLNRCRRMRGIREDGVFWKFLDPHASWVSLAANVHVPGSVLTLAPD